MGSEMYVSSPSMRSMREVILPVLISALLMPEMTFSTKALGSMAMRYSSRASLIPWDVIFERSNRSSKNCLRTSGSARAFAASST